MTAVVGAQVRLVGPQIEVLSPEPNGKGPALFTLTSLPDAFLQWQLTSRRVLFSSHLATGDRVRRFQAHLPVVVTYSSHGVFPVHTANKGVGLLPRLEYLQPYIQAFKGLLAQVDKGTWQETLAQRIAMVDSLYSAPHRLDRRCLGSLEIFLGQTYRNILADPRVTLHYTGEGPNYPSFQVNAIAQVVYPGDPHFEFLYWARQLFEYDAFHIQQPAYPAGYLFWVCEVYDKSPSGGGGRRIA
ncbi:MAG: hypothetical protein ACK4K2_04160 [Dehalococcoidia bacterium]